MAVLLRPELIPPRLRRGCIAIDLHHLADAVKGAKLRYMTLAMESRERDGARSVLLLAGAVLARREPIPPRLGRGCIAIAFTAGVRAVASMHHLADAAKGVKLRYMTLAMERERDGAQIGTAADWGGAAPP